ncbi:pkd2 [Symbiodinium natans]|uniref:Pkd2 protein n=1 Tax=Symbiodinium natans TaxID=878477 RepID=A0A812QU91_9DINO|nr:pkd2 [Symbiodinium natans]
MDGVSPAAQTADTNAAQEEFDNEMHEETNEHEELGSVQLGISAAQAVADSEAAESTFVTERIPSIRNFMGTDEASHVPKPLLCASLVVTLIYWLLFVYSQAVHQNSAVAWEIRATFQNLDGNVLRRRGKSVGQGDDSPNEDVLEDFAEAYDWLLQGYFPRLWQDTPMGRGRLAGRLHLVGGVRLARQWSAPLQCEEDPQLWMDIIYNESCSHGATRRDGAQDTYWLDISQDLGAILVHLSHLQSSNWLSADTNGLSFKALFYNRRSEHFVLLSFDFLLEESGYLRRQSSLQMIPSNVYTSSPNFVLSSTAADVLAALGLAACVVVEVLMWWQTWKSHHIQSFVFNVYRIVSLIQVVGGIAYLALYAVLAGAVDRLSDKLREFASLSGTVVDFPPGNLTDAAQGRLEVMSDVYRLTEDADQLFRWTQWLCFWYLLVLLLKFGEGLPVSPRLRVFVNTLHDAMGNILYFFIVFSVVFVNFAMGAHFLFGHILYSWSRSFLPFASSFRVLMGDFDFMAMYAIAPVSAIFWFTLFTLMVGFVLMNLFIAIVTFSFDRVQQEALGHSKEDALMILAHHVGKISKMGSQRRLSLTNKAAHVASMANPMSKLTRKKKANEKKNADAVGTEDGSKEQEGAAFEPSQAGTSGDLTQTEKF